MAVLRRITSYRLGLCLGLPGGLAGLATAADFSPAHIAVYFSPSGGATAADGEIECGHVPRECRHPDAHR